ncbi:MAG: hypothetical protein N2510_01835 [Ignavibacteria bacterium]|nr:hypothetical protein [Ignavibacteria bacterium]
MNFFDQLVIPASENHIMVLRYMLIISLLLFVPYVCMVFGGIFLSTFFNRKAGNLYSRFAKDVIEKLTITPKAEFALGIVPALSALFAYAQLLYMSETIAVSVLSLAVVIFTAAFIFIYRYRNTFKLERVLSAYRKLSGDKVSENNDSELREIKDFESSLSEINRSSGTYGKYLLLTAIYLFVGTTALASSPHKWLHVGNILQIIFSWQTLFNFLCFTSLSAIVTGAAVMFYFFSWNGGIKDMDDEYSAFVKSIAGKLAFWGTVFFPVTLIVSYLYLPSEAQSPGVFYFIVLVMLVLLVTGNFIYSTVKTSSTQFVTLIFMMIILLVAVNIGKDQLAFSNAVKVNVKEITVKAEEKEKELKGKLMQSSGINVEEIFNQKCVACHKFDQRVVGPPYDQVVPKYNGDVQKLAEFIYNPQKIDPAYPPMPNQGLKKKEASAMAQWLIEKVSKK